MLPRGAHKLNAQFAQSGPCGEKGHVHAGQRVGPDDSINVDQAAQGQQSQRVTILIHKPVGYVSGQPEDGYQSAASLINARSRWREDRHTQRFSPQQLRGLAPAGRLDPVPEALIDAASCVSGCGPAWVYQFIEALADGGVACGLPRAKAQEYAAQMVLGSAKLVLESGKHPGELKDAVCSPGGSTIQGVRVLEEHGLRGAVMDAVIASYNKTKEMGKG